MKTDINVNIKIETNEDKSEQEIKAFIRKKLIEFETEFNQQHNIRIFFNNN